MMVRSIRLPLLLAAAATAVSAIWPAPQSISTGKTALWLTKSIEVTYNGASVRWRSSSPEAPSRRGDEEDETLAWTETEQLLLQLPYTYDTVPDDINSRDIVKGAVARTLKAIFEESLVPWKLRPAHKLSEYEPSLASRDEDKGVVKALRLVQTGEDGTATFKPLAGEVDESYRLTLTEDGEATLTAPSAVGILRGLETFAQLFYRHSARGSPQIYTPYAPVSITDRPKFAHRGVLLDLARNWYPVDDILRTIDAIAWNKMNRLHLHVTDSQSWPLEIPSMPDLAAKGSYGAGLTYSPEDVRRIQSYAVRRGVEVIFEIDMPGHIGSLFHSRPELIVAYNAQPYHWWCAQPPCGAFRMNSAEVDAFLGKLFDDLLPRLFPYSAYFHTGGDELNKNDSMLDPGVRSNSTAVLQPLLQRFIDSQHERIRKAGMAPIVWEEIPLEWEVRIGRDVVVQSWLGGDSVKRLTSRGHKVIDSNYNFFYLDCGRGQWLNFQNGAAFRNFYPFRDWCDPTKNWRLIYSHDPVAGLSPQQAELVIGGEVAVWSETIDPVVLDSLVWPRASAAAEVLWSGRINPATGQNRSQYEAAPRLAEWRERLLARGVRAAPITQLWCTQAGDPKDCSYEE